MDVQTDGKSARQKDIQTDRCKFIMSMNCLAGGTPVKSLTANPSMSLARPERGQFLVRLQASLGTLSNHTCLPARTSAGLPSVHPKQCSAGQAEKQVTLLLSLLTYSLACSLRSVVVKRYSLQQFLHGEVEEDPTVYIQHEVTAMKQFQHPNIQSCLTSFVWDSEVWVVTPLMSYGSVKDLMTTHMPEGLPELACCLLVRDLCQALQYLHSQGVVHRAVRASHVLLRDSGAAVLAGLRYCTGLQATGEGRG